MSKISMPMRAERPGSHSSLTSTPYLRTSSVPASKVDTEFPRTLSEHWRTEPRELYSSRKDKKRLAWSGIELETFTVAGGNVNQKAMSIW